MAGQGRAPQEMHVRARNDHVFTELEATGELHGPDLPDDMEWHTRTRDWWEALRGSPMMANQDAWSWAFMLDTALMHHIMWTKSRWEFASEIRLRVAKYGATPEDKMRLKIKVVTPKDQAPDERPAIEARVSDISSRRARLTS